MEIYVCLGFVEEHWSVEKHRLRFEVDLARFEFGDERVKIGPI